MGESESESILMSSSAFAAYRALREIADKYKLEMDPPRIVIVGETSTGKSMLVQNFLGFPCTYSESGVATRCPVAYQLRYNSQAEKPKLIKPAGVEVQELASYLGKHMRQIETESKFSLTPFQVEIESNGYADLEILDVPGLVAGNVDMNEREAVERITEFYVRDPNFLIVLLIEANQELANCVGARTIDDLCTGRADRQSGKRVRVDYKQSMLTIQTKFDLFMNNHGNGAHANKDIMTRLQKFTETYFVSMIVDARVMSDESFDSNVDYMKKLPEREKQLVDKWIEETINEAANKPNTNYPKFNSAEYRKLIGINIVREKIRSRWLKAFISAMPELKVKLARQLTEKHKEFDVALNEYQQSNPSQIRSAYLRFIHEYRRKLALYAKYKSEIDGYFPHNKCGSTYEAVENDFTANWPRRIQLTWRAHLSTQQLKNHARADNNGDDSLIRLLDYKLIGSSHFDRLQKVFSYMILAFQHGALTAEEIITIESLLYGGLSCSPNVEKFIRDTICHLIRQTFTVGIAWLVQMYTYFLDTFLKAIINLLLADSDFVFLKKHIPFLKIIELDYHRRVRNMMRKAIHAIRDTRFAYSMYSHYDLTEWLKKLTFKIPVEIQHSLYLQKVPNIFVRCQDLNKNSYNESDKYRPATVGEIFQSIKVPKLLDIIFGSESYLTDKRDPKTNSHHPSALRTVDELYQGTSNRLLYDIRAHFNAHVVIGINEFDRIDQYSPQSIMTLFSCMPDIEIARIANINLKKVVDRLDELTNMIGDLKKASVLLDGVEHQLNDAATNSGTENRQLEELSENHRQQEINRLNHKRRITNPLQIESTSGESHNSRFEGDEESDENQRLLECTDSVACESLLQSIYERHDLEDLKASLLEGDALDQDDAAPAAHGHLSAVNADDDEDYFPPD